LQPCQVTAFLLCVGYSPPASASTAPAPPTCCWLLLQHHVHSSSCPLTLNQLALDLHGPVCCCCW
jgi:hypothetical protein